MIEDFVPYDHWRDFEEFALRIVAIKIRDSTVYDNLYAWRTQDTADQGVDGNGYSMGYAEEDMFEFAKLELIQGQYPKDEYEVMVSTKVIEEKNIC